MTTNIDAYKSGKHAVWAKIWKKLGHSRRGPITRRCWTETSGTPAVDMADYLTYPVQAGDFCYDIAGDSVWICTVAVAAATDATFVECNA